MMGSYIRARLSALHLSQVDLARHIKKHQTYINKIANGRYVPPIKVLKQIAEFLEVPISELVCFVPKGHRGYPDSPLDFGIETRHGLISDKEMSLIEAFRRQPPSIQDFLLKALIE